MSDLDLFQVSGDLSVPLSLDSQESSDPAQRVAIAKARALNAAAAKFALMLPSVDIDLTPTELQVIQAYQECQLILGAAGVTPVYCANECPFLGMCPLAAINKHPLGRQCPFEVHQVRERFLAWLQEFDRTLDTLLESERSTISTLVSLDIQEMRCNKELSKAQNALMQQRSVRDVNEAGEPICWEDVVHINAQRLDQILTQRRMLLKDFELTREAQTRRAKALGLRPQADLSSRQSSNYDRVRAARKQMRTIDASPANP